MQAAPLALWPIFINCLKEQFARNCVIPINRLLYELIIHYFNKTPKRNKIEVSTIQYANRDQFREERSTEI